MAENKSFWVKHRATILYGISLALLMFLMKWLELRFILFKHSYAIYIGFIAVIFTTLGIWLALKLSKPKVETVVIEKEVYVSNNTLIERLGLSNRELDILRLMAQGHSNQEI